MTVCLLLIHDGRHDYRERTLASASKTLPEFKHTIEVDDSDHRLGFAGAIREGWRRVLETGAEFCFHLEGDFTFNRKVPLRDMVDVLDAHPYLAQIALLRQPWNEQEKAAGGIVDLNPGDYTPKEWNGHRWLEHRRHFTTNPALYPVEICEFGWPEQPQSEGHFGIDLFRSDPALRAAYWGEGEEWVEHLGVERHGHGY